MLRYNIVSTQGTQTVVTVVLSDWSTAQTRTHSNTLIKQADQVKPVCCVTYLLHYTHMRTHARTHTHTHTHTHTPTHTHAPATLSHKHNNVHSIKAMYTRTNKLHMCYELRRTMRMYCACVHVIREWLRLNWFNCRPICALYSKTDVTLGECENRSCVTL